MEQITTVGLDLAKSVFQVHGIGATGEVLVRRRLRRSDVLRFFSALPPCLVGMEACGTAHYWGREISKLGHTVKLMPAAYVKPYVKRGKTDMADAEAITEAVARPTMRFVAIKSVDQQAALMLHRVRDLLVRQRTMLINALRGHLAEFGIVGAQGPSGVGKVLASFHENRDSFPSAVGAAMDSLVNQLDQTVEEIKAVESRIMEWHRANEASRRLATIPGIGPITASAIVAAVPDASLFPSGRQFAAWLGLTPKAHSSGGKDRMGGISKSGRRLYSAPARDRRHRRQSARKARKRQQGTGDQIVGAQTRSRRVRCPGQQNRQDRLGPSDARGGFQRGLGIRISLVRTCFSTRDARGCEGSDDAPVGPGIEETHWGQALVSA
jgi:transposase